MLILYGILGCATVRGQIFLHDKPVLDNSCVNIDSKPSPLGKSPKNEHKIFYCQRYVCNCIYE